MTRTPREKAIYMEGLTFGVMVGMFAMAIASLKENDTTLFLTALIIGVTMGVVTFVWHNRVKQSS